MSLEYGACADRGGLLGVLDEVTSEHFSKHQLRQENKTIT